MKGPPDPFATRPVEVRRRREAEATNRFWRAQLGVVILLGLIVVLALLAGGR